MQNYQHFIDELFCLNIDTVQYFVKNGQVLYDQLPQHYTAEQLAETPADWLPGHLGIFMSLDRYDQHQPENRYADTLVELQRRAVTDLLLLEPAQINRLLFDAKNKCEKLSQLLKNAMEYQKAWGYGTLDLLSNCFLELRLLDAFTIKSRPEASPHNLFAHHLTDAIMYKRGILSGFIEQIENTLQTAPAVLSDTAQEPEYDLWYVNNDDKYAFAKFKELARYLPTIEPFTKRVEWFFETSRIWEVEPCNMGVGSRMIPDPKDFSRRTDDGKPVDKNGQRIEEVAWGLSYSNDEEKGILHKLYFLRFYRTHRAYVLNKPRPDFDQLLSQYSTNRQTERGKRLQWEWVTGQISDGQQLINDWVRANPDRYGNPEIKRQLQNAAILIEQELEGIPAIKWGLFYRTMHLDPFALLWGLVEYKRFLETEELSAPVPSTPLASDEPKNSKPVSSPGFDTYFDSYIVAEHRATLMPYLTENYANTSPERYGYMLYALVSLKYVPNSTLNNNQSALHRALTNTFGEIGTRQALNTAIRRLDPKESNDEDKRQIEEHKQRIVYHLKPVSTN